MATSSSALGGSHNFSTSSGGGVTTHDAGDSSTSGSVSEASRFSSQGNLPSGYMYVGC